MTLRVNRAIFWFTEIHLRPYKTETTTMKSNIGLNKFEFEMILKNSHLQRLI